MMILKFLSTGADTGMSPHMEESYALTPRFFFHGTDPLMKYLTLSETNIAPENGWLEY